VTTPLDRIFVLRRTKRGPASPARSADYEALLLVTERIRSRFRKPADFATLSPGEQLVFRVAVSMDPEMQNGGIDQYLRNASGDDAQQVIADLEAIGAERTLAVLQQAAQWFEGGVIPSDLDERFDQLLAAEDRAPEKFEAKGDALSRRYSKAAPDLYKKLMDFVERRREDFMLPDS
jgi:hypothetical protein